MGGEFSKLDGEGAILCCNGIGVVPLLNVC